MAAACGTVQGQQHWQRRRLPSFSGYTILLECPAWMDSASANYIEEWDSFTVKRASKSDLELAGGWKGNQSLHGAGKQRPGHSMHKGNK